MSPQSRSPLVDTDRGPAGARRRRCSTSCPAPCSCWTRWAAWRTSTAPPSCGWTRSDPNSWDSTSSGRCCRSSSRRGTGNGIAREAEGSVALACEVATPGHDERGRAGLGIRSFVHGGTLGAIVLIEDRTALRRRGGAAAARGAAGGGGRAGGAAWRTRSTTRWPPSRASRSCWRGRRRRRSRSRRWRSSAGRAVGSRGWSTGCSSSGAAAGARAREPLDLSAVVEYVLELRQYALETAGIEVERDLDARDLPGARRAGRAAAGDPRADRARRSARSRAGRAAAG